MDKKPVKKTLAKKEMKKTKGGHGVAIPPQGFQGLEIVSPRDPASGLPTGKRQY